MSYVLKSNSRQKSIVPGPLKIVIGIIIVLLVFYIFMPQVLPHFFTMLVRPLWNAEQGFRHGTTPIEDLRNAFIAAENTSARNNTIVAENDELKALLRRQATPHLLLATVLKRPPFSAYDTFILDVGSELNIKVGNKVYALGDIPIGEIAEVYGGTSKVKLYSSSGEKFPVLLGSTTIEAPAIGKGGGYFEASMPRDAKIRIGDSVLIPTISNSFLGTVEGIASDPSEPFSKVLFRQPVNIYEMRWVVVDVK